jgi:hypothetical protein
MKLETQALRLSGGCYDRLMPCEPGPYPLLVIAALILRAREDHALAGAETENPSCRSYLHRGPILSYLAAIPNDCKGYFRSFEEVSLCVRAATRGRQSLSRGYDYFFFFEVFVATFLVAAFALFFAFIAFLAMWSSVKIWLSEHAHAVYRHAQH